MHKLKFAMTFDELYFMCEWMEIVATNNEKNKTIDAEAIVKLIDRFFVGEEDQPVLCRLPKITCKLLKVELWLIINCLEKAIWDFSPTLEESLQLNNLSDKITKIALNKEMQEACT